MRAGYRAYRIAYRTERVPGVHGTGTARLYLPDLAGPARPVVAVTHGTAGLADECAPSRHPPNANADGLFLPWVAAGFVTVTPDYAGLGNPGVQGYGHPGDTSSSVIDAGRAAIAVDGTRAQMVVIGHSQGGGAALTTQANARVYGSPDIELVAAISVAGNLSDNATLTAFRFPRVPIGGGGGVTLAVVMLALYADWANLFGEVRGGEIQVKVYERDGKDRATRRLERMVLTPFPIRVETALTNNDMTKVEVIDYRDDGATVYWRVMYSDNDSTETDVGSVDFRRFDDSSTVITFHSAHRLNAAGFHIPNKLVKIALKSTFLGFIEHYRTLVEGR